MTAGLRAAAIAAVLVAARAAHAEPSDRTLVLTGLALAAALVGGTVDVLHLFPPGRDPGTNTFRFGWTYVHGLRTRGDKLAFYLAPKVTDAVLLGGFAALAFTGAWPHNRYGQLGLTVFATGLWIDFAKDVVLFSPNNDVSKVFGLWCMTGWRQVPARLVYAGMAVGLGLIVARGYERTFDRTLGSTLGRSEPAAPRIVPLMTAAF